jgi:hypothetical protein
MLALIQDPATIDGWFVFDNSAVNASQEWLLKNQSVYTQISHIHGDLGKLRMISFYIHFLFRLGVMSIFGLRTRFDETDPNVKRLEVMIKLRNYV